MEVIGNALELKAFDRMEEDIRLIGYFKSEESERECARLLLDISFFFCCPNTASVDESVMGFPVPSTPSSRWIYRSIFTTAAHTQLPLSGPIPHAVEGLSLE